MNARDSAALLSMVEEGSLTAEAATILRRYFAETRESFWSDALESHGLI